MKIKITQKIALSLLISAIVPSTFAADDFFLRKQPGFSRTEVPVVTTEEAKIIMTGNNALVTREHEKRLKEGTELADPTVLVHALQASSTSSTADKIYDRAEAIKTVIDAGDFGVGGKEDITPELALQISILNDLELDPTIADNLDFVQDPLVLAKINENKSMIDDSHKLKALLQVRTDKGGALAQGDMDAVDRHVAIAKMDCHNIGPDHQRAYAQLTDVTAAHVKIAKPSGIEIDSLAAWMEAGNDDPTEDEFNFVKSFLTTLYRKYPKANLPFGPHFMNAVQALGAGKDLTDQTIVNTLIDDVMAAIFRQSKLGYRPLQLPRDNVLVATSREVISTLSDKKLDFSEVNVDALLQMLDPVLKPQILGANDPTHNQIIVFGWLRAEEAPANRWNPTALRAADLDAAIDLADRINADRDKYLGDASAGFDLKDMRALEALDTMKAVDDIDFVDVLAVKLMQADPAKYLGVVRAITLPDVTALKYLIGEDDTRDYDAGDVGAVRYLQTNPRGIVFAGTGINNVKPKQEHWEAVKQLQVKLGVRALIKRPRLDQIKAVVKASGDADMLTATAWRIQQGHHGHKGYVPAGVARVTAINADHTVDFDYIKLIDAAMPGTAAAGGRIVGDKFKVDDAILALLNKRGANLAKNDIITFDSLDDDVAGANLVALVGADRQ